eukprot:snap_masked-scaffold_32-processed-gene-2.9-mRNA-1 protein AED:1.00 eAED:1.00 QI:0/-1/0/0/-1/1/1/0/70
MGSTGTFCHCAFCVSEQGGPYGETWIYQLDFTGFSLTSSAFQDVSPVFKEIMVFLIGPRILAHVKHGIYD